MSDYLQELYAQRSKLLETIARETEHAGIASYSLSDSDGSQSTSRRSLRDLYSALKDLNNLIAVEETRGRGGGVMTMQSRF
jgi:hypothetical protein